MSVTCRCPCPGVQTATARRRMTLRGSRGEALEYLPASCENERLELAGGRISLVCERTRVDVRIVAERGADPRSGRAPPELLLELAFEGRSEREADAFVERYRRRARLASGLH